MKTARPLSRVLVAVALLATAPALGCKIISAIIELPSDLSASSSRSIAGSFDAISASSGSGGGNKAETTPNKLSYNRDLREFTAAFAKASGSREDVPARRLADRRGSRHQSLGSRSAHPALDRRRPARRELERGADGGVPRPGRPRQAGRAARARGLSPSRRLMRSAALGAFAAVALSAATATGAERGLAFVYVSPNVGLASGGHAALRADDTVYHLQNADAGLLLLVREGWSSFHLVYAELENRPLEVAHVDVAPDVTERVQRTFSRLYVEQELELGRRAALRDDVAWLEAFGARRRPAAAARRRSRRAGARARSGHGAAPRRGRGARGRGRTGSASGRRRAADRDELDGGPRSRGSPRSRVAAGGGARAGRRLRCSRRRRSQRFRPSSTRRSPRPNAKRSKRWRPGSRRR